MRKGSGEEGVALVTVIVILGAMALLMGGVYALVNEGIKSANKQVSYRVSYASSESGAERLETIINMVSVAGYSPEAPDNYGIRVDSGDSEQWDSHQDFADYLRNDLDRYSGWTCNRSAPDIRFRTQNSSGEVRVDVCVERASAGSLPGGGDGVEFANAEGNMANEQSSFELDVWASGSRSAIAQLQGIARGIY